MDLSPEVEARFIEQEHRIVRVVQNYFDRKNWPADDPRRVAARNAVIWRVLAPGTAAVAASGIIALATLGVLVWQTGLIADQNMAFKEQNNKLQLQIDQQADQDTSRRRTEIIAVLYETQVGAQDILQPKANPRTRGEAVLEFVQLERQRLKKLKTRVPSYQVQLSLTQARLDGLNLDNSDLQDMVLVGAFLQNTSFSEGDLRRVDLRAAQMQSTSFRQTDLQHANFEGSALLQVSFARSDLRGANFTSVSISGCEFLGADLREARLTGLKNWADNANFRFANIAGARGLSPEARQYFLKQGAVEMLDEDQWSRFKRDTFKTEASIER
ncbi:hypothetical protein CSQ96_19385 [Janthinobacterium sp. BJB412]|nr:hypothetical protein CSQ96_19385 [Janthinobacterium sp. BJB412]